MVKTIDEFLIVPDSTSSAEGQIDLKVFLRSIFSKILRHPDVNGEDDFFDLGGDSILAVALFNEIEHYIGKRLPVTSLYEAPTVNALASILTETNRPKFSCPPMLKSGKTDRPLFLIHGIRGGVMELRELARLTDIKQAIYGLEAAGIDEERQPYDRVDELAQYHVEKLIAIQPAGPYYLAGYSFGGLVAIEMALILSQAGNSIALLALIDTFTHTRYLPVRCRLAGVFAIFQVDISKIPWLKVASHYASIVQSLPFGSAIWFIVIRAWRLLNLPFNHIQLHFMINRFRAKGKARSLSVPNDIQLPINIEYVAIALSKAFKSYRPKYYPHEITLIKAESTNFIDPYKLWGKLCSKLTVRVISGDHHSIVKQDPRPLALELASCVIKASQEFTNQLEPKY